MGSYCPIKSIAIIGAGPVGVACAKYLLAENAFEEIDLFEQRANVGGVWNLSPAKWSKQIPVPQTDPRYGRNGGHEFLNQLPAKDHSSIDVTGLEFESPLYDYLETNIPKPLMAYSDYPFHDDEPLFPSHQAVLRYLEEYAEDVRHLIRFNCRVNDISIQNSLSPDRDIWKLVYQSLDTGVKSAKDYDAVVVANGHYTVPYLPNIKGAEEWHKAYPGVIIHSKAYRKPEDYTGKKVLVIGNSASGLDIAGQVGEYCLKPILMSSRSVSAFGTAAPASWRDDVDEVVEFLSPNADNRAIRLKSGRIVSGIEAVIFATGYFYSFPFLSNIQPPVIKDGFRTRGVFEHIFHIEHPSIVFPVINLKVIPFPLAQNQAAVISRVWSGRLSLPSKEEMRKWEDAVIAKQGDGKYFHLKKFPEDATQINQLYRWAAEARNAPGLENDGHGKMGMTWNERQVWMRSKFPQIKAAFAQRREGRHKIKTIEELGFDFDRWRQEASSADLDMFEIAKC